MPRTMSSGGWEEEEEEEEDGGWVGASSPRAASRARRAVCTVLWVGGWVEVGG